MTDKQIIIDGVDVISCNHFDMNFKHCDILGRLCREHNNCDYKQRKRKEQECEFSNLRIIQMQETLSQYETDLSTTDCIAETLKAQNKELKAENGELEETIDGLLKVQYQLADSNKKLRECFTEIKEIAEELKNFYEELGKCEDLTVVRLKQILQKISEVEDE